MAPDRAGLRSPATSFPPAASTRFGQDSDLPAATNENFSATSRPTITSLCCRRRRPTTRSIPRWIGRSRTRIASAAVSAFGRPVTFQAPISAIAGGPAQGAFEGTGTQKTYSTGINYNRCVSPTLLTEVRVGVAHYHNEALQSDYGKNDTTALGIPGVNLGPFTSGIVGITINGYSSPLFGYSASLPWDRAEANIDMVNSWTKILRNHTIKWGVDYSPHARRLAAGPDLQPARRDSRFGTRRQTEPAPRCPLPGHRFGMHRAPRPRQRYGQLPAGCSQPGSDATSNTYFPAFRQWQVFSLRRGQLAGIAASSR